MTNEELLEIALCCNRCGTCRGVVQDTIPDVAFATQCPCGMTMYGSYEPSGLMYMARGIAQGDLKWNEDMAKVLYSCTMCGYCEDFCARGYRHTPANTILEEMRRIIPEELKPKAIKRAADTLKGPASTKLAVLQDFGIAEAADGKATTLFFADGTLMANAAKLQEIGYVLQQSGKKVACFMDQPLPPVSTALLSGGCETELQEAIKEIDARLADCGAKTVVVYNPESLSVLKRFSQSDAEFVSITRFGADVLKKAQKIKKVKLPTVTYQDPCQLGRFAKDYTSAREIIKLLGLDFVEMWRSGRNSLCCGAGGGVLASNPKLAKRYAENRWHEAEATGATVMLTACPFCTANLNQAKPDACDIIDITSLVAQALGYSGKEGC